MTHRKRKLAENTRKRKPWKHSTGPKTAVGKAASSMNATKHGMRNAMMMDLYRALAAQNRFLRALKIEYDAKELS